MLAATLALWLTIPDPLIADLPAFPFTVAEANWRFSLLFLEHLDRQIALNPQLADELGAIRCQARYCERAWDALDWCGRQTANGSFHFDVGTRRKYLAVLRDMLGEEAYRRGAMPPPVPLWCLPRIN